jgi:hypothetical protein
MQLIITPHLIHRVMAKSREINVHRFTNGTKYFLGGIGIQKIWLHLAVAPLELVMMRLTKMRDEERRQGGRFVMLKQ